MPEGEIRMDDIKGGLKSFYFYYCVDALGLLLLFILENLH